MLEEHFVLGFLIILYSEIFESQTDFYFFLKKVCFKLKKGRVTRFLRVLRDFLRYLMQDIQRDIMPDIQRDIVKDIMEDIHLNTMKDIMEDIQLNIMPDIKRDIKRETPGWRQGGFRKGDHLSPGVCSLIGQIAHPACVFHEMSISFTFYEII